MMIRDVIEEALDDSAEILTAAEIDILADEIAEYAKRLQEAGVPCTYLRMEGMIHAFFNMIGVVDKAGHTLDLVAAEMRKAFQINASYDIGSGEMVNGIPGGDP